MKKLLLLLTALLTLGGGAWAEVTQPTLTTDVNNPIYYTIGSFDRGGYLTYNGANANLTHVAATKASLWYFMKNGEGEGVSIIPAVDPTVKLATVNSATAAGAVWYLKENPYNAGYFCISLRSDLSWDCIDANNNNTGTGFYQPYSTDYAGTSWAIEEAYNPSLPEGKYISVGEKARSFTAASSGSDNEHWYILTQTRYGETPAYNAGLGSTVRRAATAITTASLEGASVEHNAAYMVRFISAGDGLYNLQFADGNFINSELKTTELKLQAGKYAFYNTVDGGTTFGWNLNSNTGSRVDNNGAGYTLAFWESGKVTATEGNMVWSLYPVTFTDAIHYSFTTTDGAFFAGLSTNKTAGPSNYCNLWLSKNTAGKPQLKLITDGATASEGNNMRSTGGLSTTESACQYNLSVSEGKIKSYTIVGTAVGALSITPAGGSAEEFEAGSVNKRVELNTPAKQTSFTLSGSNQWLNVEKFIIEYESDATTVTSLFGINNAGIYTLEPHNAERGVMYAGTTYMDACGGHANTDYPANSATAIDATDPNQQFVLYTYGGNTYLYNVGRAKFAGVADGLYYKLTGAPVNPWTVSAGAYDKYFHLTSGADNKMATINAWNTATATMKGAQIDSGKDHAVTGTTDNEEANNFLLRRVGTLTSEQQTAIETIITNYLELQASLTSLSEHTIGAGLNQYANKSLDDNNAKDAAITTIREGLKGCESSYISTANTQVQAYISAMNLNMPATNTFLRIRSSQGGNACLKAADASTRMTFTTTEDKETIFLYSSDNKLISYSKGLAVNDVREMGSVGGEASIFSVVAAVSGNVGQYSLGAMFEGNINYLYSTGADGSDADRNTLVEGFKQNNSFTLETVSTLPVTITAAGYATLYAPVALTIPDGVTAYVATDKGDYLTLTAIDGGIIPANTGVILAGEADTYNFVITTDDGSAGSNALTGTVAAIARPDGSYILSNGTSGVGFYKDGATTIPGFKAYLPAASPGNGVKTFRFNEETAIEALESAKEAGSAKIYNLAGQRVTKAKKGIYSVGGRKVVIK